MSALWFSSISKARTKSPSPSYPSRTFQDGNPTHPILQVAHRVSWIVQTHLCPTLPPPNAVHYISSPTHCLHRPTCLRYPISFILSSQERKSIWFFLLPSPCLQQGSCVYLLISFYSITLSRKWLKTSSASHSPLRGERSCSTNKGCHLLTFLPKTLNSGDERIAALKCCKQIHIFHKHIHHYLRALFASWHYSSLVPHLTKKKQPLFTTLLACSPGHIWCSDI